ncbi:MAG: hypothetical protein AAF702_48135 [Chloroflexota bacterium]
MNTLFASIPDSFIIRVWYEKYDASPVRLRYVLLNVETQERWAFTKLDHLFIKLSDELSQRILARDDRSYE